MRKAIFAAVAVVAMLTAADAQAVCGCTDMTVARTTGNNQIICVGAQHGGLPECDERTGANRTTCTTTYEYFCPVGVNSQNLAAGAPTQQTGFGVTATLTGTESQCTSGQLLTLKITGDGGTQANPKINRTNSVGAAGQLVAGVTFDVDNDSTHEFPAYPIGGGTATDPEFGGDNYRYADNATVLIERANGRYRWWDNSDQGKDRQAEVASWKYKFVSWVKGSSTAQKSCACAFDVEVAWDANKNPATTYTQDATYSNNCTW